MQALIKEINESAQSLNGDRAAIEQLYNKYAPALYGKIIRVVKQKDISEKILEKIFLNAVVDKNIKQPNHLTFFTSLLNHSRQKTYSTMKALRTFEACSCGFNSPLETAANQ
ncbi:MAG: hypothetical protein M3004_03650 [Bacteroidota bacterium]|nr:hypothetical protein [Bacteroidota bacterium]